MNRYRFEQMKKFASISGLQIVKARLYNNDDELTDFAMVGFRSYGELKAACETLDLVPMSIRIVKDSSLHDVIKTLDAEEIYIEIINRAKAGRLDSSSSCYQVSDEMRNHAFIGNNVSASRFHTKLTTNKMMFDPLVTRLSNLWGNVLSIMADNNSNIAEKRLKIKEFRNNLELHNASYSSSEDWDIDSLVGFQERVIDGLKHAYENEDDEKFIKFIDGLTKMVTDYINMNDSSMLVLNDNWLSEFNYEVVPIKFSMVDKYSERMIYIMGAVAYGENTYL